MGTFPIIQKHARHLSRIIKQDVMGPVHSIKSVLYPIIWSSFILLCFSALLGLKEHSVILIAFCQTQQITLLCPALQQFVQC